MEPATLSGCGLAVGHLPNKQIQNKNNTNTHKETSDNKSNKRTQSQLDAMQDAYGKHEYFTRVSSETLQSTELLESKQIVELLKQLLATLTPWAMPLTTAENNCVDVGAPVPTTPAGGAASAEFALSQSPSAATAAEATPRKSASADIASVLSPEKDASSEKRDGAVKTPGGIECLAEIEFSAGPPLPPVDLSKDTSSPAALAEAGYDAEASSAQAKGDGGQILPDDDGFVCLPRLDEKITLEVSEMWLYFQLAAKMPDKLFFKGDQMHDDHKKVFKAKAFPVKIVEVHSDDDTFKAEKHKFGFEKANKDDKSKKSEDEPTNKRRKFIKGTGNDVVIDGVSRQQFFGEMLPLL